MGFAPLIYPVLGFLTISGVLVCHIDSLGKIVCLLVCPVVYLAVGVLSWPNFHVVQFLQVFYFHAGSGFRALLFTQMVTSFSLFTNRVSAAFGWFL